jgi:hypothetical protein
MIEPTIHRIGHQLTMVEIITSRISFFFSIGKEFDHNKWTNLLEIVQPNGSASAKWSSAQRRERSSALQKRRSSSGRCADTPAVASHGVEEDRSKAEAGAGG